MNLESITFGLRQTARILGLSERAVRDRVQAESIKVAPGTHLRFRALDLVGQECKSKLELRDLLKFVRKYS